MAGIRFMKRCCGLRTRCPISPFSFRSFKDNDKWDTYSKSRMLELQHNLPKSTSLLPTLLAFGLGIGSLKVVLADANEAESGIVSGFASRGNSNDMRRIAVQVRQRLDELLRSKGMPRGLHPSYSVGVNDHQVTIKFKLPQKCNLSHLIADVVSHLGLEAAEQNGGGQMLLRAWNSAVAWQLMLSHPSYLKNGGIDEKCLEDKCEGCLRVLIFESLVSSADSEVSFIKQGSFTSMELDAIASALKVANANFEQRRTSSGFLDKRESSQNPSNIEKSLSALEAMGVRVFGLDRTNGVPVNKNAITWENIAGYDQQKRDIEDTILLALQNPDVYDKIAYGTRRKFESNRPRAVLFEGPPGTGKTSCARVIANQAGVPLLYVPLEVVMSKYYGESERLLGQVFSISNELPNGAIVFLDEVDSFATTRDNEMHEATRRILSVLLRQIDGFEQDKRVIVIAATNRKQDLDPALLSRFDSMITFELPDEKTREEIAAQYAKHLNKSELAIFASVTEKLSGRDIRDVCQQVERHWASKVIRAHGDCDMEEGCLPPIHEYIQSAEHRRKALFLSSGKNIREESTFNSKQQPLAMC